MMTTMGMMIKKIFFPPRFSGYPSVFFQCKTNKRTSFTKKIFDVKENKEYEEEIRFRDSVGTDDEYGISGRLQQNNGCCREQQRKQRYEQQ